MIDFQKWHKRFLAEAKQSIGVKNYVLELFDILDSLRPPSQLQKTKLMIAREHLKEIRKGIRRLEGSVKELEEQNKNLQERLKILQEESK